MKYVLIVFFVFCVVVPTVVIPIIGYCDKRAIEKSRSRNVEFYTFHNELQEKAKEYWDCEVEANAKRQEIDNLIVRIKYAPAPVKETLEKELEMQKQLLFQFETCTLNPMKMELDILRDRQRAWQKQLEEQGEKIFY